MKLRDTYPKLVKASANKFLYTFNIRHMFRILHSISCFEAENNKMKEQNLSQLWVAESFRTLVDRVKDEEDVKIFDSEL